LPFIVYTINGMEIEFDPVKDAENIRNHGGLSLELATELDWDHSIVKKDDRFFYDEVRFNAIVPLENRLYHVTFTERGKKARIISLRYATRKEVADYVKNYR